MIQLTTTSSPERVSFAQNRLLQVYVSVFFICWIGTFIGTPDMANWWIENVLTIALLLGLTWSYRYFKFSDLSYTLVFIYILLHIYGAQYTYAENPLGYWLKDTFHSSRNHYDRIVHFSFGFLLVYPMRDYFKNRLEWPNWVCWTLPIEITLSFSAAYELIEWLVADLFFPEEGIAFLGTQGDVWDAQKDMGLAFSGAVLALLITYVLKRLLKK